MKLDGNTALLKSFSVKYLTNFDYLSIVQRVVINLSPYRVYIYRNIGWKRRSLDKEKRNLTLAMKQRGRTTGRRVYRCTYHVSEPLHVSPDVFTF